MKSLYIKDLEKNLIITGETFLITEAEKSQDKNGKDFYKLVLSDKTGKADAKIWADRLINIPNQLVKTGSLVLVSGKVEEYRGSMQINVFDLQGVDETKLDDYIESSVFDADEMMKDLEKEIKGIKKEKLRQVILDIVQNEEWNRKLKFWPAGRSIHHGFRSGMLQHILEMLAISKGLKKFYPDVDYDVLTAGIILHDIGKLEELGNSPVGTDYSKKGSLMGHISIGFLLFHDFAKNKLEEDIYLHVSHLILAHHGTHEFGSPVLPSTTEAVMLYYIDNLSSKSRTAYTAINKIKGEGEEFSDFNRWLGGIKLWKGTAQSTVDESPLGDIVSEDDKDELEEHPTLI